MARDPEPTPCAPIEIDGSRGEGGGQILRSSLTLAALCGRPLRITRIRAGRRKDGLLRQHLTAVRAVATLCHARVDGAEARSTALSFTPGAIRGGAYHFAVGTAGSAVLVCQTVLPVLLAADAPSEVVFEGGTHNPNAPPFEFLDRVYLPALAEMGVDARAALETAGFFPRGGGRFTLRVTPGLPARPFTRLDRRGPPTIETWAHSAHLPAHIGEREMAVVQRAFDLPRHACRNTALPSPGPGNAVAIELRAGPAVERVTAFGRRGLPAERVAEDAVEQARAWLAGDAPVGEHLADQLVLPVALAGGAYRAAVWSSHAATHVDIVRAFLGPDAITVEHHAGGAATVRAPGTPPPAVAGSVGR